MQQVNNNVDWSKQISYMNFYDIVQANSERYQKTLKWQLDQLEGKRKIIDTGAGTGNLTKELLDEEKEVVAVDINPMALKILKDKCESNSKNSLDIYEGDLSSLNFIVDKENSFDAATSMLVLPLPEDINSYLKSVYKLLKKGGKFVISAWSSVSDIEHGAIDLLEKELKTKGVVNKHEEEWKNFKSKTPEMTKFIIEKQCTKQNLKKWLTDAGFQRINFSDSPYGTYQHALVCEK